MRRKFTDANALFGDLLDRHEAGTERPVAYPDYAAFASVVAMDSFIKELRRAEAAGAVNLAPGRGRDDDQVAHVRLEAANALYRHLGRTPIAGIASEAHARTIDGLVLHQGLLDASSAILSVWSRAK